MPKKDLCEIIAIIDRSGSMESVKSDAIGGLNAFMDEQKKVAGQATVTMVFFNHEYEFIYQGVPIADVKEFDEQTYVPAGMTALLDAVGRTIDSAGERLANTADDQKPEKVVVAILTDGLENASKEYRHSQIMEKIKCQRETYKWEFVYLGANQDAFAEGAQLGIDPSQIVAFAATPDGTRGVFKTLSSTVKSYRTGK
jgi:uncharacterized protein YegL